MPQRAADIGRVEFRPARAGDLAHEFQVFELAQRARNRRGADWCGEAKPARVWAETVVTDDVRAPRLVRCRLPHRPGGAKARLTAPGTLRTRPEFNVPRVAAQAAIRAKRGSTLRAQIERITASRSGPAHLLAVGGGDCAEAAPICRRAEALPGIGLLDVQRRVVEEAVVDRARRVGAENDRGLDRLLGR
jgi:hypothetical protein